MLSIKLWIGLSISIFKLFKITCLYSFDKETFCSNTKIALTEDGALNADLKVIYTSHVYSVLVSRPLLFSQTLQSLLTFFCCLC